MGREKWLDEPVKILSTVLPIVRRFSGGYSIRTRGSDERGVLSGSTFRSHRFRIGTVDRSSVNRSISQTDPQGISSFLQEQVPLCTHFSSPSFHRVAFHAKKRIMVGVKKSNVSYSIAIVSFLDLFHSIKKSRRKKFSQSKWFVVSFPFGDNLRDNSRLENQIEKISVVTIWMNEIEKFSFQ